jgi:endonuclease/exonuclease/phosphatase (EEP) superfamily protein YafD
MVRHAVQSRTTFAAPPPVEGGGPRDVRQGAARSWPVAVRVLLAPAVLACAGLAGAVFAILLPLCGIATIAEAVAKLGWKFVRGALSHPKREVFRIN